MTFLVLSRASNTNPSVLKVIRNTDDPSVALEAQNWALEQQYDDVFLAEVLIPPSDPLTAIPAELDRAIDEWNARIVGKLKFAKAQIRARSHYVGPYRKWKKELGKRDYFLWQLIDDVLLANDFTQAWMRFGLLFAKKDGEYHSDLFRAGHYRDKEKRAPEPPETEAQLAERREGRRYLAGEMRAVRAKIGSLSPRDEVILRQLEAEGF